MNPKIIKSILELVQTIVIGWLAIYGMLSLVGDKISIVYGRSNLELTTGYTFLCIALGLLKATWESVFTSEEAIKRKEIG